MKAISGTTERPHPDLADIQSVAQADEQGPAAREGVLRILVIEDDFASRQLLAKILEPYGSCDLAVNAAEGFEAFQLAWNRNTPYQLLCLDILMPGMNGRELLKMIRQWEQEQDISPSQSIRVVMTTVDDDAKSVMESFQSGCESYLVKPIRRASLLDAVRKLHLIW